MEFQGYVKTKMLNLINGRSKMFHFETPKKVLLATIHSKVVTA